MFRKYLPKEGRLVMATLSKPGNVEAKTPVFVTSKRTYKHVIDATAKRQQASPELKAFVERAKGLIKGR